MTMISEKETILKGLVVATADYDTGKKIIGISSANLTPNEAGIAPLSKQTAFVEETKEELPNTEVMESLTFIPNEPESKEEIQESAPLIDVNPQELNEINVDILKGLETKEEEPEEKTSVPVVDTDLEMPIMEEVVAQEPDSVNEDLFASLPSLENLTQENTSEEVLPEPIGEEIVQSEPETSTNLLNDLPILTSEEEKTEESPEELPIEKTTESESTEEKTEHNLNEKELLSKILEQLERNNEMMQTILNEISEIKNQKHSEVKATEKITDMGQSMVIPSIEPQESTLTL